MNYSESAELRDYIRKNAVRPPEINGKGRVIRKEELNERKKDAYSNDSSS